MDEFQFHKLCRHSQAELKIVQAADEFCQSLEPMRILFWTTYQCISNGQHINLCISLIGKNAPGDGHTACPGGGGVTQYGTLLRIHIQKKKKNRRKGVIFVTDW